MPLTTIQSDGWRGSYTSPPTEFDPVGSPETFSVTRSGFDATGTATSVLDTITIMKRVREPYPNQGTLTANDVSLSDFIYAGETISGVTNNSTLAYPKPISMWMDHDRQRTTTGNYIAKLAVAHAYARDGRPVAAVKFIASDGVNTDVEVLVSSMSTTAYDASGLTVSHFEAALDFSTLDPNVSITIDAVIYPWVGDAYQISVDAPATQPTINLAPLRVFNDVSFGTVYGYVDPVSGDDGTGVLSADPATAEASPFATTGGAGSGMQAFNDANFARNEYDGGVIRLLPGTHFATGYSGTVNSVPIVVEAADPADKASTIYTIAASNFNGIPSKLKLRNLTAQHPAGNFVTFSNGAGAGSENLIVFENVTFDLNGQSPYAAFVYKVGRSWFIDCDGDFDEPSNYFSLVNHVGNMIGCGGELQGTALYNIIGTKVRQAGFNTSMQNSGDREPSYGHFIGYSFLSSDSASLPIVNHQKATGTDGVAVVANVLEKTVVGSANLFAVNADGNTEPAQNVVVQGNTMVGQRTNVLYNDAGDVPKSGFFRNNVFQKWNSKSDIFDTNGANTGNWSVIYHVGDRNNGYIYGSSGSDEFGVGSWLGEVAALGDVRGTAETPLAVNWVDDASSDGSGLGLGDYTPGASTALQQVPANDLTHPFDIYGNVINMDGTAYIGAQSPAPSAADEIGGGTLTAGAPAISGGALGQNHEIGGASLTFGAPALSGGAIRQTHAIAGAEIASGSPSLSGGAIVQAHEIGGGDIAAGTFSVSGAYVGQVHEIGGASLATAAPFVTGGAIQPISDFGGATLAIGAAVINGGSIAQIHLIAGTDITGGSPSLSGGAPRQIHLIGGTDLEFGTPSIAGGDAIEGGVEPPVVALARVKAIWVEHAVNATWRQ